MKIHTLALFALVVTLSANPVASLPLVIDTLSVEDVVATRGGVSLPVSLVDQEVAKMPAEIRAGYLDDAARFGHLVDSLLLTKQLATEAWRREISVDDQPQLEETAMPTSLADLNTLANKLLATQAKEHSEQEYELLARERWQVRKSNYATEEAFVFRHILIERDSAEASQEEGGDMGSSAKELAQTIMARTQAGENFIALSRELGGDDADRWLAEHRLTLMQVLQGPKSLQKAIVQLGKKPGISNVLEDEHGYHIYALLAYEAPETLPFEEVRERIITDIKNESAGNARTTFMRSFSLQDVELNDQVIQALPSRYAEMYGEPDEIDSVIQSGALGR